MIDEEKDLQYKIKSRQIINEILDYGVSQKEIKTIIKLLALELEDTLTMKKIINFLDNDSNIENKSKLEI